MISDHEAKEMVNLASRLRQEVEEWLRENHPDLMEE
jgi:predicted DNA-binding ribbon-helix-helix protein